MNGNSIIECGWCKISFKPRAKTGKFCSNKCLRRHHKSLLKHQEKECLCSHCGSIFIRVPRLGTKKNNTFCSRSCGARFWGPRTKAKHLLNPINKVQETVRKSIRSILKNRRIVRNKPGTFSLMPYSKKELYDHVESYFSEVNGFTWENHGKVWELDHIIPQSKFSFLSTSDPGFIKCWSLSNLAPMLLHENRRKGNRYSGFHDKYGNFNYVTDIQ